MRFSSSTVAVVTGAGSGIGRCLAVQLAEKGCNLSLWDVNTDGLQGTVQLCRNAKGKIETHKVDVSNREMVYCTADKVIDTFGKVNIVFNNAGVAMSSTIKELEYEDLGWIMSINFYGVVYGTKAFLPHFEANPPGESCVVNISSIFGLSSFPRNGPYCATKFAVRGFTEALRAEQGHEVQCVSVHPGGIQTNIAKNARFKGNSITLNDNEKRLSQTTASTISKHDAIELFEKEFHTTPTDAAATIIRGVEAGSTRVLIGGDAMALDVIVRCFPETYLSKLMFAKEHPLVVLSFLILLFAVLLGVVLRFLGLI